MWILAVLAGIVLIYIVFKLWKWIVVPRNAPTVGASLDSAWYARMGITTQNYEIPLVWAGGRILELRPGEEGSNEEILNKLDALFLTGGGDVAPHQYGKIKESSQQTIDKKRDEFEIALITGALERNMPVLAICRGSQILNVSQGGTLKNLRNDPQHNKTHGISINSMDAHTVKIGVDTQLAGILGTKTIRVNSFHGQAIDEVGEGLTIAARADDGVIEAIEHHSYNFVIGIQWHSEVAPPQWKIFKEFLRAAKKYRKAKKYKKV